MPELKAGKLRGYHYAQSEEGAFAVEVDAPCDGAVTLTWKPREFPGKSAEIEMPHNLFLTVAQSYIAERNATKSPGK